MDEDQKDTSETDLADQDGTQEEQADDADNASNDSDDSQSSDDRKPLLAGKYKSVEQLEAAYKEAERFIGNRKQVEEKAAAYDRLVAAQAKSAGERTVDMPMLADYVDKSDGTIDVAGYDKHMKEWRQQSETQQDQKSRSAAQEAADLAWVEKQYPYMAKDVQAARTVIGLYRSGQANSIREAAQVVDDLRQSAKSEGAKGGASDKEREISRKVRGNTEHAGAKVGSGDEGGEMSPEKFAKMSREDQKTYINKQFKTGKWGGRS